jgi:hypothetical protein
MSMLSACKRIGLRKIAGSSALAHKFEITAQATTKKNRRSFNERSMFASPQSTEVPLIELDSEYYFTSVLPPVPSADQAGIFP